MAITISILTFLALLVELYLQRAHNENSLKPLGQIHFIDSKDLISVRVSNAGMGPMIIDRLTFVKGKDQYSEIAKCLSLDGSSYMHATVNDVVKKVLLPNAELIVFSKKISDLEAWNVEKLRNELASLSLRVDYRSIYNKKFVAELSFEWFRRHLEYKKNCREEVT